MSEYDIKYLENRIKVLEAKVNRLHIIAARSAHPYEDEYSSVADFAKRKIEVEGDKLIHAAVAKRRYHVLKDEMRILLEDYKFDPEDL